MGVYGRATHNPKIPLCRDPAVTAVIYAAGGEQRKLFYCTRHLGMFEKHLIQAKTKFWHEAADGGPCDAYDDPWNIPAAE